MKSVGAWIVIGGLSVLLCLAGVFLYVGWYPADDDPNYAMSGAGYFAMTMGIVASLALGIGLMSLLFYSSRRDQD